jgi:predicted restriction endonuclease
LEKVAATARTMPNRVLDKFKQAIATMPRSTETERLVVQRVGQDFFRKGLLDYWQGRCCMSGLAVPDLLRASHIKPWAECESDEARLDVFNGLLLSPNLDALFDGGWITVMNTGAVVFSSHLPAVAKEAMGLGKLMTVNGLQRRHFPYLAFHRERVFRGKLP